MILKTIIKLALKEDVPKGDITTDMLIPKNKIILAKFIAKENGVICGLDIAKAVFQQLDKKVEFKKFVKDGREIKKGQVLAEVEGKAQTILTAERTALNFLQHLSGIATLTRKFVKAVRSSEFPALSGINSVRSPKIYDTRKTTPLIRELEKYAVRCGGGYNHRMNLSEMILIKDNHLKIVRKLESWKVEKLKRLAKKPVRADLLIVRKLNRKVEIEAQNYAQVKKFVKLNPDIIMLDNMDCELMKKCIKYIRGHSKCEIEVSGNVNLKTVGKIASLKPDRISVGEITHSASALDISLEF
ncbi:MAG: carboxylating nicotinate-nucleotide diphosphorylase [Elusimicrobiota bacterium]